MATSKKSKKPTSKKTKATKKSGNTWVNAPSKTTKSAKTPTHKALRLTKTEKPDYDKIPNVLRIFQKSLIVLKNNWRLFLGIIVIYGVLNIVLVKGFGGGLSLGDVKHNLQTSTAQKSSNFYIATSLFSYLLTSSGSTNTDAGGAYQTLLVVLISLVVIWALRQVHAGHKVKIKDAYYNSTTPMLPFILVLLVIGFQLLPMLIGGWIYTTVINSGVAVNIFEKIIWGSFSSLLALWTLYMICSSLLALYIVTLPDMRPIKALRSAKNLVRHRRFSVMRKVLFLPLALVIVGGIIMVPFLLVLTPIAETVFFLLVLAVPVLAHSYMYSLYRSLL